MLKQHVVPDSIALEDFLFGYLAHERPKHSETWSEGTHYTTKSWNGARVCPAQLLLFILNNISFFYSRAEVLLKVSSNLELGYT